MTGLKQGWAFAWRSLLAGELLVIIVGQRRSGPAVSAQDQIDMATAIAPMIVILVLGIVIDRLFSGRRRERRRRGMTDPASS